MIHIGMDPNIFTIGGFTVSWHGFFIMVAVIVAIVLTARLAKRAGISEEAVYSTALWAVPGGIVGARLLHVIDYWDFYAANPGKILAIWSGGLAIYGAVLGGTLVGVIYARVSRFPVARLADYTAPGIILAQAIGRIGDIINGEHQGIATSLPWGVVYTHPNTLGTSYASHPAVAYEMLWDLLILWVLLRLLGRIRPDGMLFLFYFAIYSFGRFFISFLREDLIIVAGLSQAQIIALVILAITVPILVYRASFVREAQVETSPPELANEGVEEHQSDA